MAEHTAAKNRILDAAEELFAERGFAHTSLRTITAKAQVNAAAVNYYFGSKDVLIEKVLARRLDPINAERLRRLDEVEQQGATLEGILEAFIVPILELNRDKAQAGEQFIRLLGRSHIESADHVHEFIHQLYTEVTERFKAAFARALPELPTIELYWRLHFLLGTVSYTMAGTDLMRIVTDCKLCTPSDSKALVQRLIPFLVGGMKAPLPEGTTH